MQSLDTNAQLKAMGLEAPDLTLQSSLNKTSGWAGSCPSSWKVLWGTAGMTAGFGKIPASRRDSKLMTMMAQRPDDTLAQWTQMAAPPPQMSVDPHATLTAPISPAPIQMTNELGDPTGRTNELGDALPEKAEEPPAAPEPDTKMSAQKEHMAKPDGGLPERRRPVWIAGQSPRILREAAAWPECGDWRRGRRQFEEEGGTTMRGKPVEGLESRLEGLAKDESTEGLQGAEAGKDVADTGKTEAETPEIAPNAESQRNLQTSEITEHNAQAAALLHPQAKTDFEAWQAQNPGKPIEDWIKLQNQSKTIAPEQQYLTEYAQKNPGSTVAQAEHQYMLDTQRPPQVAPVNMFVPGQQPGTETLTTVRPGQTVGAGAQTAAGVNAVNTPTTQQRTAAGRAETVVAMAPEVLSRIDALAPKIGPIAGRWNDFMQGKVGSDDPDFAALRSDLLMMSSAVALAHAQGRLPENLREEFDRAINAPKQTPQNLKATINAMLPWLQQMQHQGQPNQNAPTTPRPANVPEGYELKDGPKGRGWYAPAAK
jgi:hypothetical protein